MLTAAPTMKPIGPGHRLVISKPTNQAINPIRAAFLLKRIYFFLLVYINF